MDKRLKIFVDAHCFDTEYQGSRTFVKEIYKMMMKKKDLLLYIAAYRPEMVKAYFPCADNVVFLKYRSRFSLLRLIYDIPRLIKKHRIDFAHFQYITPLFKNCKQVVTIHDVIFNDYPAEFSKPYRLFKKYLYNRSAQTADIVTTVSAFSKSSIQQHLNTNGRAVHIIPNGVNRAFFEEHNKEDARSFLKEKYGLDKFILYVSRIEPRKNHLSLLKAFFDLKTYQKDFHLVFIGHTTMPVLELNELLSATSPDVRRFIFFSTNINEEELLQFYRAATVFIYPSKAEGFGIPPLEAGAACTPVVCSNASAMREYSFFGDDHIDPTNYETLKSRLSAAIERVQDSNKLKDISERIRKTYSWEKSAEKLYHLIKAN